MPTKITKDHPISSEIDEYQSYLTLGGWDEKDITGDVAWFDTSKSQGVWNATMTDFRIGDVKNMHTTKSKVTFQTGYPFIGLPTAAHQLIESTLKTHNPDFNCVLAPDYGVCRLKYRKCREVDIPSNITIAIENYDFNIPINNLLVDLEN